MRRKGFPLFLALQGFLGSLQLLCALGGQYYPMVNGWTGLVRFDLGVSLGVPLGLLLGYVRLRGLEQISPHSFLG